jgi:Cu(I)/Ag(I) efflux system membrane protein CusA/SilA
MESVFRGASEVSGAVMTAVLTTVVSFLPVFTMEGAEGKLFKPLAYTKTFALLASIVVALVIIPPAAHLLLGRGEERGTARRRAWAAICFALALAAGIWWRWWMVPVMLALGVWQILEPRLSKRTRERLAGRTKLFGMPIAAPLLALLVGAILAKRWEPVGPGATVGNFLFTVAVLGSVLFLFQVVIWSYESILRWCLRHKLLFLSAPLGLLCFGALSWVGFASLARPFAGPLTGAVGAVRTVLPAALLDSDEFTQTDLEHWGPWRAASRLFPGLGREFMPALDEGSFLLMPVTMAHASIGEAFDLLQQQDMLIGQIPEVSEVVGKIGRVDSPLDPAPVSMVETVINYKPEYKIDAAGERLLFAFDETRDEFLRDSEGQLIPDEEGRVFRQWRDKIETPRDIWDEIERAASVPGMTTASMLQPIETRRIMLQTGMRAPMGIKVYGPDLETIEQVALDFEKLLRQVPALNPATVLADRVIGKPYLEIDIDRAAIARYGLSVRAVQDVIEVAIGGRTLTHTVEGRERYPVRVRYPRDLRDQVEELGNILVPAHVGVQVPLGQLANLRYTRGPQVIKSEETFLVAYVLFDKRPGVAEVDAVQETQRFLSKRIESGDYTLPAGVSYRFAGNFENQQRAASRLRIVLPLALFLIFMILYLQFRSTVTTGIVFSAVFVAWSGGLIMLWLYGQDWFLNFSFGGVDLRELFQIKALNLSVAVWVGFLALFGIATDDGVIMATYLKQSFESKPPADRQAVRDAVVQAGRRRIRPCLMTTATTCLALLPVLSSTGRGSDVMVPMAIPSIGGMAVALITIFVVPTLYCQVEEWKLARRASRTE